MTVVHEGEELPPVVSRVGGLLARLGGGDGRALGERHERPAHIAAGAVVLLVAGFAWLVASMAVSESERWPVPAVLALTLLFGLLVGAVTRASANRAQWGHPGVAGRAAAAVAVGVVVGELAALVVLSGSIDRHIDERALRNAASTPAVVQASASLEQTKDARTALDTAVEQARERQDRALVVARCEYHPTPGCPQTRITGVPGIGPETRTANERLADAQHEFDEALAARDHRAPELDATIARERQVLAAARDSVVAGAGRGLGARWVAMNDLTLADAGALTLRLATIASCALLCLLPLILALWRGQTSDDRRASARAERERAELDADTAIAIKRAEVRREAEIMWAEHQLTQARLAIEAQVEIDRERQRRRVQEALEAPVRASAQRPSEPTDNDTYLPIAAEAEAASRAVGQLPGRADPADPEKLPARAQAAAHVEPRDERSTALLTSLPDATKVAARWVRPLVPSFAARVIRNTTQPLRTARQVVEEVVEEVFEGVFEEVEEIAFSLKRTRKVTVKSQTSQTSDTQAWHSATAETTSPTGRIASSRDDRDGRLELLEWKGPRRLDAPEDPRQLPPAE